MNRLISAVLIATTIGLAGCAAPLVAPAEKDTLAKEFVVPPSRSAIYIYRNENFGGAIGMPVTVNGKSLGETGAKTYFRINVPAGSYAIDSHGENFSDTHLQTEAGRNYFVWQEVKMGIWKARSELKQVDEKTGRAGVLESKLITSLVPDDEIVGAPNQKTSASPPNVSPDASSPAQKLRELQGMLKDGLITEYDYQQKKQKLLDAM